MPQANPDVLVFLEGLSAALASSPIIAKTETIEDRLVCHAVGTSASAHYRICIEDNQVWVSFVTNDRWLSESIEADLMNSGDKLEELIEDELADLGARDLAVRFQHFRSDDLLFTFRSSIEIPPAGPGAIEHLARAYLLAYVACFAQLGDVVEDGDD